jgi:hypothetical protein
MITIEQIEEALGDDKNPFQIKDIDHDIVAISLLRERIPYHECENIISGAEHDILYLCDLELALPYLSEDDLVVLTDCNVGIDRDNECFYLFL